MQFPFVKTQGTTVDPEIFFAITDHHLRRHQDQKYVIGALVGFRSDDGRIVHVKNSFPLDFSEEDDSVTVDPEYLYQMYQMHQKVRPREYFVGWYSTSTSLSENTAYIHNFFASEFTSSSNNNNNSNKNKSGLNNGSHSTASSELVHLVLNPEDPGNAPAIQGYVSLPLSVGSDEQEEPLGNVFSQIPIELKCFDAERSGLNQIYRAQFTHDQSVRLGTELNQLEASLKQVQWFLKSIRSYLRNVSEGKVKANSQIGRYLLDALYSIPLLDENQLHAQFMEQIVEVKAVFELIQMTKTQMDHAERLHLM